MGFEAKTIDLPTDLTLQYVEQGDPSGVPVLLLHGSDMVEGCGRSACLTCSGCSASSSS